MAVGVMTDGGLFVSRAAAIGDGALSAIWVVASSVFMYRDA
jgi:hypothetical protein